MKRLKDLKEKLREDITFVVVPGADSQVKRLRLPRIIIHGALAFVVIATITVNSALVYYFINSKSLQTENGQLSLKMVDQTDRISRLEDLYSSQTELNQDMKEQAQKVAEVYDRRLIELENVETKAIALIAQLNEANDVNISVPVSRSFDRTENYELDGINPIATDSTDSVVLEELIALIDDDEITLVMEEQLNEYTSLIDEVENTLDFLECKPDLKPVFGRVTSGFGLRRDPVTGRRKMHKGLDIANERGTSIVASGSGVVTYSGYNGSYGKTIIISHGYGYKTVYAHNNKNTVEVGDTVEKGQVIGEVGNTGKSTGPHVHFEVHYDGKQIDPAKVIN